MIQEIFYNGCLIKKNQTQIDFRSAKDCTRGPTWCRVIVCLCADQGSTFVVFSIKAKAPKVAYYNIRVRRSRWRLAARSKPSPGLGTTLVTYNFEAEIYDKGWGCEGGDQVNYSFHAHDCIREWGGLSGSGLPIHACCTYSCWTSSLPAGSEDSYGAEAIVAHW